MTQVNVNNNGNTVGNGNSNAADQLHSQLSSGSDNAYELDPLGIIELDFGNTKESPNVNIDTEPVEYFISTFFDRLGF